MRIRPAALFLPIALLLAAASSRPAAAATVPGDEWETTTKMTMEGMPVQMPARTTTICRPKVSPWNEPPVDKGTQDRCKIAGYQLADNHATWKMTCEGGMSGTGDITYQPDSYKGTMTVTLDQGTMKMDLSGRRTGKDCDADEIKKTIARAQKQADDAVKGQAEAKENMCKEGAASANRSLFMGPGAQCKTPDQKAAFCAAVKLRKNYEALIREGNGTTAVLSEVTTFCGLNADGIRRDLCAAAVGEKDLQFVGRNCPAEAKSFAAANCAGRKFTSIPDEAVRNFCSGFAEKLLSGK